MINKKVLGDLSWFTTASVSNDHTECTLVTIDLRQNILSFGQSWKILQVLAKLYLAQSPGKLFVILRHFPGNHFQLPVKCLETSKRLVYPNFKILWGRTSLP